MKLQIIMIYDNGAINDKNDNGDINGIFDKDCNDDKNGNGDSNREAKVGLISTRDANCGFPSLANQTKFIIKPTLAGRSSNQNNMKVMIKLAMAVIKSCGARIRRKGWGKSEED